MKRSIEELLTSAKSIIGDNTGDDAISFLEDLADSFEPVDVSEYETKIADLETANADLREKYISRFGATTPVAEGGTVETDEVAGEGVTDTSNDEPTAEDIAEFLT